MKKLVVMIFVLAMFTACSGSQQSIDVSFYGTRGNEYHLIYDTSGSGILFSGKEETFHLSEASEEVNPWTAIQGGEFYVTTDAQDKMASFGKTVYHTVDLPDGSITLNGFAHLGDDQVVLGADFDSQVWAVKGEDDPVLVAEIEYRDVEIPDGETRTLLMRKGKISGDKWVGDIGGKIYEEVKEGELKQIGFVEWRLIKMKNGNPMTIMMAKGMGDGAKWQGRFNDTLYIDK